MTADGWSPAIRCDLNDGATAFASAVKHFREWAETQPKPPVDLTDGWYVITPQLAEFLLIHNRRNRKLRYKAVLRYGVQMLNRRWKKTGEPVIVTDRDEVDDAGHRLFACYFSGASFETYVVRVPHDDQLFAYIDNGESRTGDDTLESAGLNGLSKQIAKVIEDYAIRYDEETLAYAGRCFSSPISNVDILDYANRNPSLVQVAKVMKNGYPAAVKRMGDAKIATFVAWKIYEAYDQATLDEFMASLTDVSLPAGHPVKVLQKRLDDHDAAVMAAPKSAKAKFKLTPIQKLALVMRAFNFAQQGTSVRIITPNADDPFPRIEPPESDMTAQAAE
jgi:hypothetical protein